MTTHVHIGKRVVALEDITLIEPFDQTAHPGMRTDRAFKARIGLIDRQSVLTEETVDAFAKAHDFHAIPLDGIAINPAMSFAVETFVPVPGFEPSKPFQARLQWRDHDGDSQSKLLLTPPDPLLELVSKTREPSAAARTAPVKTTGTTQRRSRRRTAAATEPAPQ